MARNPSKHVALRRLLALAITTLNKNNNEAALIRLAWVWWDA